MFNRLFEAPEVTAAFIAAIAGIVSAVVSWFVSKWSTRKNYQYERSKHITQRRFDDEYEQICLLSEALYRLVEVSDSSENQDKRGELAIHAKTQLAKSALPLYLLSPNLGHTYCGVDMHKDAPCRNLHMRAVEIIMNCEGSVTDWDATAHFEQFIRCAQCRLRNIEMGRRDTRRTNFKEAVARALRINKLTEKFDARCPYEELEDEDNKIASHLLFVDEAKHQ